MQNLHNKHGDAWDIAVIYEGSVEECTIKEQELLDNTDLKRSLNCHLSSVGGSVGTEPSKEKVFALLDWAVENQQTREKALTQFHCSWDALRKYQPKWEELNGKLELPLRASGENSGNYKHGMSKEKRRKRTEEELEALREQRREAMIGENNHMFGNTHTDSVKTRLSDIAKAQWDRQKRDGYVKPPEATKKTADALRGVPKTAAHTRAMAMSQLGKLYDTPFGVFYTSKECEEATGVKAATVMWRCKNNYLGTWTYISINKNEEITNVA